jgi:hypothetical protein
VESRIGKLSVPPDAGSIHSAMNVGNISCTGASLKVAPFVPGPSPPKKVTATWHVPTDCPTPDSSESTDDEMVHTPDAQAMSSIWVTAAGQSEAFTTTWPIGIISPQFGVPKVTLPSAVCWADAVCANKPAASKIAICDFIVAYWLGIRSVALQAAPKVLGLQSASSLTLSTSGSLCWVLVKVRSGFYC